MASLLSGNLKTSALVRALQLRQECRGSFDDYFSLFSFDLAAPKFCFNFQVAFDGFPDVFLGFFPCFALSGDWELPTFNYEAAFPCRFQEDSELASNHEIANNTVFVTII
jgi:hypothetical protein